MRKDKVVICAIIKDEHEYIKEWVEHNLRIGFDRIYLCEDIGSKSHADILSEYDKVTLFQYNDEISKYRNTHQGSIRQQTLFNWFLSEKKGCADWCAFIDPDEYIMFDDGRMTVKSLLRRYENEKGLYLSWKMYGASGHITKPVGNVVDNYTKECNYLRVDNGYTYKSIINLNTEEPRMCGIHKAKDGVNTLGIHTDRIRTHSVAWINHYFTKSWEDWVFRLKSRGDSYPGHRKINDFFECNTDMLDMKDELIKELYNNQKK